MLSSVGSLFKALAVVALSLLAAVTGKPSAAPPAEKSGFVAEMAARETVPCVADARTLCLNGGRFKVQVNWSVPSQGTSGAGTGVALTGDTGYFWFFSSNNIELVLKVVDGRGFNGKFWVFYGALTNVQYSITITDTVTGTVRTYANPFGSLASVADTAAFDGGSLAVADGPGVESLRSGVEGSTAGPCVAGDTTLCLNGGRFKVEVRWQVASQGTSGTGRAVQLTGDTGEFWFFSANNIEIVLKVVDGTAFNGKFWVFYGALSDVQYTIEVTDTLTGNSKTFVNSAGTLASVADTSGFDLASTPTPTVPAPTPPPTPTPTQPASSARIVNVGQNGAFSFVDTVSGTNSTSIRVGDTVQWKFLQSTHSATSGRCTGVDDYYGGGGGCVADGEFDSGVLNPPSTYSKTFTAPGSFPYYCTVHGIMMVGQVDVSP